MDGFCMTFISSQVYVWKLNRFINLCFYKEYKLGNYWFIYEASLFQIRVGHADTLKQYIQNIWSYCVSSWTIYNWQFIQILFIELLFGCPPASNCFRFYCCFIPSVIKCQQVLACLPVCWCLMWFGCFFLNHWINAMTNIQLHFKFRFVCCWYFSLARKETKQVWNSTCICFAHIEYAINEDLMRTNCFFFKLLSFEMFNVVEYVCYKRQLQILKLLSFGNDSIFWLK